MGLAQLTQNSSAQFQALADAGSQEVQRLEGVEQTTCEV